MLPFPMLTYTVNLTSVADILHILPHFMSLAIVTQKTAARFFCQLSISTNSSSLVDQQVGARELRKTNHRLQRRTRVSCSLAFS